ncbi:MAG: hypothetical protein JNL57_07290 [Bacteroidetes bacterium]|nr:hypothetical protein [Bacteroidota bacterium]
MHPRHFTRNHFTLILSGLLAISACSRKPARWDTRLGVPLFSTDMDLNGIDNTYLRNNPGDTSYTLVYDNLVYSGTLAQVKVPDTSIGTSFTLRRLKLSDRSISQRVTLAQINPAFGLLNGQTVDVPAQDQSNLNPVDIDASAFFETATLDSGWLDISIHNELPVTVGLVVFELRNADDNSLVAKDSFLNIPTDGAVTKSIDLRNKTVRKTLKGVITRLMTNASSGPVLINTAKGVELILSVRKLRPRTAVAAFPNQTVLDQDEGLTMYMGGPEVKFFKARQGRLRIKIESTIQENMTMYFAIPSATLNGVPIERTVKLPGAVNGVAQVDETTVDMNGYLLDFRGKNPTVKDTVNTFHQILRVSLDSSGRKVQITLKDSIRIFYSLEDLKPEYAIGYLGNTLNQSGDQSAPFELFKGASGNLTLKDFKASVLVKNYIGAEGRIKVNKLQGENVFSTDKVTLNATPLNSDIFIAAPPFVPNAFTEKQVDLNASNSNIKAFVENLPQMIHYNLDVETNPNGNSSNWKDFVFENSRVDIFLRLETPATFAVGGLNLRDTQALDMSSVKDIQRIKSATLLFDIFNDFPFDVTLEMQLLDANEQGIESIDLIPDGRIAPGKTDGSGKPAGAARTQLKAQIPRNKMEALRKARFIAIKAHVQGSGAQQKIYNSYKLKVRANATFEYEANL